MFKWRWFVLTPESWMMIKKQRYPQTTRKSLLDLLTITMGIIILLVIALQTQIASWLLVTTLLILVGGSSAAYLPKARQFGRLVRSLKSGRFQFIVSVVHARKLKRLAVRNALLVLFAIAVPGILAYILDPITWLLLLIIFFLSTVVGRLAFFLRVRVWEVRGDMRLHSVIRLVEAPDGVVSYEHLITFDQSDSQPAA